MNKCGLTGYGLSHRERSPTVCQLVLGGSKFRLWVIRYHMNFVLSLNVLQASEEGVHFIVSRQICLPAPDILQEAPWGMDGPPPYSPVDIEQTLLVSNAHSCTH